MLDKTNSFLYLSKQDISLVFTTNYIEHQQINPISTIEKHVRTQSMHESCTKNIYYMYHFIWV